MATWPDFEKTHDIICVEGLLVLKNFSGRFSSRKTRTVDVASSRGSITITRFDLL